MTNFFPIHQAPDVPWNVDKDTIVSGVGIPSTQKYCIRGNSGNLVAVMLTKDVADAIVSAVNACDKLVTREE